MFIYWYLKSKTNSFRQIDQGAAQPNLNTDILSAEIIPLPPLAEQQRIVSAIEQWFSLIDILENAKDDLQTSIAKAKSKILDLAIRGKLVPQDPNDEPASVLLERIRAEKERLIKEGKIKRGKKSADTPNDEKGVSFEIPESWEWVKLSDIASFGGGKTPSMEEKKYWNGGTNLWITSKDMKSAIIADSMMKITDAALPLMTIYEPGTLLIVTRSGILRRMLPIAILDKKACVNQDLKAISLYLKTIHKYIYYVIKANEIFILKKYHKDGTTVDSINFEKFIDFQIPLPPLAEQQRIVAKIEELFAVLDNIKESIEV